MTLDEIKYEINCLKNRQARIFRRFWFVDRGYEACEFDQAIRAIAILSIKITIMESARSLLVAA